MIKRFACLFLGLALATIFLGGAFRPEDVKAHTLANGLEVLLLEDHDIPNIALFTFFRVGSRNERPGLTGVSHFIEHMMFNGSPKFGPGEFDRIMEFHGGTNNAYTTDDLTAYTDWFPAAALEPMLEMEADRMQGLTFNPQVLESERGVVASERRMAVENNNDSLLEETVRATSIMAHPYHWEVIGWMSDILSWRRDEISQYYRTYYAPNNAVMIVVGDFETSRTLEQIKKYFGPIAASAPPPPVTTTEPPQLGPRQVLIRKEAQAPCFLMVYHAPAWKEADFPALFVLEKALLQGESSRLYRRLVREEKLALYVGGGIQETIDPLLFSFNIKPRPGADLDRIEAVIEEELAKVREAGLTDREFQKGLNIIRSSFYFGLQTISGQANLLGSAEVLYGGFQQAFNYMDRFTGLRKEQVQEAAKKYLLPSQKTVGKLIPQGGAQ